MKDRDDEWTFRNVGRSRVGPTCPKCDRIHCGRDVTAVDKFRAEGPSGYRHGISRDLFATRAEAEADLCRIRTEADA